MENSDSQLKKETSQISSQLKNRTSTNKRFGSIDLDSWLFEKLQLKKGFNVLDVGCGRGNHIIKIAEKFSESNYYGIDISEDSIKNAIKSAEEKNLKINFICGDASDTSKLQNKFFDIIISVYALYYVKDTQKMLSSLKEKIKDGGRIAVMSPYKGNNEEWYNFLRKFMSIPKKVEAVSDDFMDTEVLPFAKSNFSNLKTYPFENRITIPSFEDLKKYWVSNIYHKEEYDKDFEEHAKEHFSNNESFVLTKRALFVIMG